MHWNSGQRQRELCSAWAACDLFQQRKPGQAKGLSPGEGLQGLLERKYHSATVVIFLFAASFADKVIELDANCNLTQLNVS